MAAEQPSYLREFLGHRYNVTAALAALAAGLWLSVPYGLAGGAIPLVLFAAGEILGALYIPGLSTFRDGVDRKARQVAREGTRSRLLDELSRHQTEKGHDARYERMCDRVAALYQIAADARSHLTRRDVERLDEATVDYLGLVLAAAVIRERASAVNLQDIESRIKDIQRRLQASRPGTDEQHLRKALADYAALADRQQRMFSRRSAIEATILSMPDQLEEIYQMLVSAPYSAEMGTRLEDSIARLRIAEELDAELGGNGMELGAELTTAAAAGERAGNKRPRAQSLSK